MLESLDVPVVEIRSPKDLVGMSGLVIPGGESSVMDKLTRLFSLRQPLIDLIRQGLPVLGTCAGMIMVATDLEDGMEGQQTLGGLDVTVKRNAFGSQRESFDVKLDVEGIAGGPVDVSFIRAPSVTRVGEDVSVLARLTDGRVVAVDNGQVLALSFHPEVTGDDRIHRMFVERVTSRGFIASLH